MVVRMLLLASVSVLAAACSWPGSRSSDKVMFRFQGLPKTKNPAPRAEDPWYVDPSGLPRPTRAPEGTLDAYSYKVPERRVLYYYQPFYSEYYQSFYGPYGPVHTEGTHYSEIFEVSPYFVVPRKEPNLPHGETPIGFEVESSHAGVAAEGGTVSLRVRIAAPGLAPALDQLVNVALLLDFSASVSDPEKLEILRASAEHILSQLLPGDRVAVLAVSGPYVETLVRSGESWDRTRVIERIRSIAPAGAGGLAAGLLEAYREVQIGLEASGGAGHVLVLSDGLAGRGPVEAWRLQDLARREYGVRGIRTSALAIGADADPDFLSALAFEGEGRFAYVKKPEEAAAILGGALRSIFKVYARNLWLRVKAPPAVEVLSVHGADLRRAPRAARELGLGEIAAGEERSLLFRLRIPPSREGEIHEIGLELFYERERPSRRTRVQRTVRVRSGGEVRTAKATVHAYERLVLGLDQIRRALESEEPATAQAAIELLETEFPALKAEALRSGDRDLIRQAALFETFAGRLRGLVAQGRLTGASYLREELKRDFYYRRRPALAAR